MKKITLTILSIVFVCLLGYTNKNHSISNITYTESNSIDLVAQEVKTKGIEEGSFHVLSRDGEKVRLLSDFVTTSGLSYNSSSDGDVPVAFENSMLYQGIQDITKTWKTNIENAGGKTNIYSVDIPTLNDILSVGHFEPDKNATYIYRKTDKTPDWLFTDGIYWTKSIHYGERYNEEIFVVNHATPTQYLISVQECSSKEYGGNVRPILETSIYNLSSDNSEVQEYLDSINPKDTTNNNVKDNNVQTVKVPSTGIDKPFIFTVVGLAVIIISGITIWTLVKTNKSKKK